MDDSIDEIDKHARDRARQRADHGPGNGQSIGQTLARAPDVILTPALALASDRAIEPTDLHGLRVLSRAR